MKKILVVLVIIFILSACCKESEIKDCAEKDNGLSYETCQYLLCR